MSLLIITVGGTIDKVYFDATSEYEVGESTVTQVYQGALVGIQYEMISLMRKDSLEMTDEDRELIRETCQQSEQQQILITHGTDTMAETAQYLSGIKGKTIVLTGAMAPARFKETDAVFNLGLATGAVQVMESGVYIAMNGQIFPAGNVQKNREQRRFEYLHKD